MIPVSRYPVAVSIRVGVVDVHAYHNGLSYSSQHITI